MPIFSKDMKNRSYLLVPLISLFLCGCSSTQEIDDINLGYYAHNIVHLAYRNSTKAELKLKPFHSETTEFYTFDNLVWLDDGYLWTGTSDIFDEDEIKGIDLSYSTILNDEYIQGFTNGLYPDVFSFNEYYEEGQTSLSEESIFGTRLAYLKGDELTLYRVWKVISYSSKIENMDCDEGEEPQYEYEDYRDMLVISKEVYLGELLKSCIISIGHMSLYRLNDNGNIEINNNYRSGEIDYIEYSVSFH